MTNGQGYLDLEALIPLPMEEQNFLKIILVEDLFPNMNCASSLLISCIVKRFHPHT
jgi:hypothetical protein